MLHRGHVVLEHGIRYVAHEQIVLRVPIREEKVFYFLGIRHHGIHIGGLKTSS